ncbi:hypothetical protein AB0H77_35180 [Streptomyces sp. NPDC050844]|uniref:three-helix bundle dimerization domain-containing protein n=1 Tax=Streptomyces sp. NPDC050844 TaxID=3155790 RepID=UPI003400BDCD
MTIDTREEDAIQGVVERLTHTYSTSRTPEEIEAAVAAAHAGFSNRPVRDFVPVLVERKVRALLDKSSH